MSDPTCGECDGSGKISIPGGVTTSGVVGLRGSRQITCPKCRGSGVEEKDLVRALPEARAEVERLRRSITEIEQRHGLYGTPVTIEMHLDYLQSEADRLRRERDAYRHQAEKCDKLNAWWEPGQPVPHLCDVAGRRVSELKARIEELEAERDKHINLSKALKSTLDDLRKERDRYRDAANDADELIADLRHYTHDWDWKYGEWWDAEIAKFRQAINPQGDGDEHLEFPKPKRKRYRIEPVEGDSDDQT